ncbi:MAG: enoyl-CoA hydratase-related protein [Desulfobacterales bacterium]|jgi:enoyl-CoA hydratase
MIINLPAIANYHTRITQLANELSDVCAAASSEKEVRAVIINWKQDEFPAETDLAGFGSVGGEHETKPLSLTATVVKFDIPVIASINGYAIGPALELVLACDVRIASEGSYFGIPHIQAGMIPWDGGTQRLSRLIGKSKAIELILTGEMINAQEAHRIGLVNRIVEAEELLSAVREMAHAMAAKGPVALRYAKEAVLQGLDMTLEQGLRLEADLYFILHTTTDRTEGIKAFQKKRKAKYKGH